MLLDTIVQTLLCEIEKLQFYKYEELKKALEVCNAKGKPNCTIFLLKIDTNAKDMISQFFEAMKQANIKGLKNVTMRGMSLSFDIDLSHYNQHIVSTILCQKDKFGGNNVGAGKTVCIDYSSPNIAKIFHIGHFRTTVLGNFIKKLHAFCGYKSVGINYLGDWGKQFGFVLLGYEKYGSQELLEKDPIRHLFDVYVQINKEAQNDKQIDTEAKKIFELMEKHNDKKYMALWSKFREISIAKYKEVYKKLGVEFDEYSGESLYEGKAIDTINTIDFAKKNDDGSIYLDVDEDNKPVVIKSDGTTLYLARDIPCVKDRIDRYNPAKILYVVSSEQTMHFEQLFKIVQKMYDVKADLEHVKYGIVSGMSTRKGTVKFLEDIIDLATEVMLKEINSNEEKAAEIANINETALILAVSTLVVMDFSAKRIKGYEFDVEKRAKNVNGTGSYFQYAHCRLRSIEEKNVDLNDNEAEELENKYYEDDVISNLLYKLMWFEKVVMSCLDDYEPCRVVTYLNDLCGSVNAANSKLRVKGQEAYVARARLRVFKCARIVIGNALRLFGLTPLNRM